MRFPNTGSPATRRLDIWTEASKENSERVYSSLKEFGAPLSQLTSSDFSQEGHFYQMGRPPVRIDILMSIEGLSFGEAWKNPNTIRLFDEQVNLISLDDLIIAKKTAGRPQDLVDLEYLMLARTLNEKS
jgi:hypothetical protein